MLNTEVHAPRFVVIAADDDVDIEPSLRGIDIFTEGDLSILTIEDETITRTFPAAADGGSYPFRWWAQIKRVLVTDTTILDAALIGLR